MQFGVQVDQQVPAADQVETRERRIADDVLRREHDQVAHLLANLVTVGRGEEETTQPFGAASAKRRERLESERNPRVAAQLMADLELARSILAQEESEWMRLAEDATQRTSAVAGAETSLVDLEASQAEARGDLDARQQTAQAEHDVAAGERDLAARDLDRTLRLKYERLRGSRRSEVLVPATNSTCTACYTAIPRSRIGQLQADGLLLDGCEMCGAILYLAEVTA